MAAKGIAPKAAKGLIQQQAYQTPRGTNKYRQQLLAKLNCPIPYNLTGVTPLSKSMLNPKVDQCQMRGT